MVKGMETESTGRGRRTWNGDFDQFCMCLPDTFCGTNRFRVDKAAGDSIFQRALAYNYF